MPNIINQVAGENGCTPLHEAAMAGREDVVRLLKEECRETLNMDARTQHGPASTPLHLAAERGHTECVLSLLECGATITAVDRRCRNARDVAKENGKRQVVQVITLIGECIFYCMYMYMYLCYNSKLHVYVMSSGKNCIY